MNDGVEFVAHAKVQGQPGCDPPVILKEPGDSLVVQMAFRVSSKEECFTEIALKEVGKAVEAELRLCVGRHIVGRLVVNELAAELESMLAVDDRNVVNKFEDAVRAD